MINKHTTFQFNFYPQGWWDWLPWWHTYPRDEDGPPVVYFGIGPFQWAATLWGHGL